MWNNLVEYIGLKPGTILIKFLKHFTLRCRVKLFTQIRQTGILITDKCSISPIDLYWEKKFPYHTPLKINHFRLFLPMKRLLYCGNALLLCCSYYREEEDDPGVTAYPIVKESAGKLLDTGLNTLQKTLLLKKEVKFVEL